MTQSERNQAVSRAMQPPGWRLRKLGQWWFVTDLENPSVFVPHVCFSRRKDAVAFADRNASALVSRYREEGWV
jgi:hypothetical protein